MGRADEGLAHLELSRTIAAHEGTAEDLLSAYANLCEALDGAAGRTEEAVEAAKEGIAAARRLGVMGALGVFVVAHGAEALLRLGRWDEAEEMASLELLDYARPSAAIRRSVVLATLEVRRGRLGQARRHLDKLAVVRGRADEEEWARFHGSQAELAVWEGDCDAALGAARAGLAIVAESDDELYGSEMCAHGVRAAVDGGKPEVEVIGLVEEGRRLSRRPLQRGAVPSPEASVFALVAEAEYTRLGNPDPDRWADVASRWRQLPRPFHLAYAKWREGEAVLAAHGSRVRATEALSEAHHTAVDLGAALLADEVQRLATRARVDLEPTVAPRADAIESAGAKLGLTPREGEVLALLGQGRTNRQIAEQLFISEKTASVHVSNILRKLDVASRFEAAEVGQRVGLA
jgi:DNA-binding CsgD family transcriptional regulator